MKRGLEAEEEEDIIVITKKPPRKKLTKNLIVLIDSLIPISDVSEYINITHEQYHNDICPAQWEITRTEYGEKTSCPCGKNPIYERCYIRNIKTGAELYVGNDCIKHFSDIHDKVCRIAKKLRKDGINVRFESECCTHYHFKVISNRTHSLIQFNDAMVEHFKSSPLNPDTMAIVVEKNISFTYNFVKNRQYIIHATIDRHVTTKELMYVISGTTIPSMEQQIRMDFEAYQADKTEYRVKLKCESPESTKIELSDGTHPIKEQIKARWRGQYEFNRNPPKWIVTRRQGETLMEIREWLESL